MDDLILSDLAVRFYPVRHHDTNSGRIQIARAPGPSITATRMFTDNAALTQQLLGQLLVLQPSTAVTTCLVPELQQLVDAGAFPGSNKRLYDDEDGVSQELLDRGLVQKCAPGQWQLTVAGVQQLDQTLWLEPTGKVFTPRAVKVDDLSQLECQLELERRGWQMNNLEDNRQGAFAPFKGGSEVWYTDKSGAFFITYARCLLKWDELRADHVERMFHGQISAYYQALLQCSPDKRPSVVPWKPSSMTFPSNVRVRCRSRPAWWVEGRWGFCPPLTATVQRMPSQHLPEAKRSCQRRSLRQSRQRHGRRAPDEVIGTPNL